MIAPSSTREIVSIAESAGSIEACGLVVLTQQGEMVARGRNVSREPEQTFVLDRETMLFGYRSGSILAVYHTHPKGGPPSEADRRACNALGLPYLVYSVPDRRWYPLHPEPPWQPLVGRPWDPPKSDCLALVRDYFKVVHGLSITAPRADHAMDCEWPKLTRNWIGELSEEWGFVPVEHPWRRGDVMTFKVFGPHPDGIAIYLGSRRILHHGYRGPSRTAEITRIAERRIVATYRHRSFA